VTETALDLTGVVCPLNWVRTRLALERLTAGDRLTVRLDPGEAIESVPRSAREEGHEVEVMGTLVTIVKR
jgi:tRNA 2-thiouridine synthesizing protein A